MTPILIILRFGEIDGVSDRTARSLFRDLSKFCRRIQVRETEALMRFAHLNRRERQSFSDRIAPDIESGPVYYLKSAETGSIEIAIYLSALGIWLLQATVGETLKSAWKETRFHNSVVDWVKNRRQEKISEIAKEEIKDQDFLSGRATALITDAREGFIEITLKPNEHHEIRETEPIYDDRVIELSERILSEYRPRR